MSTFHGFTKLPAELRLQIWQLAIRPAGSGVHHFSILHTTMDDYSSSAKFARLGNEQYHHTAAAPRCAGSQEVYSWRHGNHSSYLWDAGLWTACRESREIIMAHFSIRQWGEIGSCLRSWIFNPAGEYHEEKPAIVVAHHNNEELHLMVKPRQDLFCLDPRDFELPVEWNVLFYNLPFSRISDGYGPLKYIAVEFDPSWNAGLRRDVDPSWDPNTGPPLVSFNILLQEQSPRGFIVRAVYDCIIKELNQDDHPIFWLLDRGIRREMPPRHKRKSSPAEFYDLNHKYIETTLHDMDYDTFEEYFQTAVHFVHELGVLASDEVIYECLGVLACS